MPAEPEAQRVSAERILRPLRGENNALPGDAGQYTEQVHNALEREVTCHEPWETGIIQGG